jgi:hypothetical protein
MAGNNHRGSSVSSPMSRRLTFSSRCCWRHITKAVLFVALVQHGSAADCDGFACNHGGQCKMKGVLGFRQPQCQCASGYAGDHCDDSTGCDHQPDCGHGQCVANGASHSCNCSPGYDGDTCDRSTGCDGKNCNGHGSCAATGLNHVCTCTTGWESPSNDCSHCVHECADVKPNTLAAQKCTAHSCYQDSCQASCRQGYNGDSATYSCDQSGTWTATTDLSCTPQACDDQPVSSNTNTIRSRQAGCSLGRFCAGIRHGAAACCPCRCTRACTPAHTRAHPHRMTELATEEEEREEG